MKKVMLQLAVRQSKRFRITYNEKNIIFSGPIGNLVYDFPVYRTRFEINHSRGENNTLAVLLYDRGLLAWFKTAYKGVYSGFSQQIVLNSNSFKADYSALSNCLLLDLGFSHSVCVKLPENLCKFSIQKRTLLFFSHDKSWLRAFSKWFQKLRIPDSYKGKGILFQGQIWKTKPGKQRQ